MSSNTETSRGQGFIDKFVGVASKIGSQRHLAAIRDGFVSMMPIIIAGSIAHILVLDISLTAGGMTWRAFLNEHAPWFVNLCLQVWWGTFGMIALFAVFGIAYHLVKSYDADPLSGGVIALASYFTLVPQTAHVALEAAEGDAWGLISWSYTSANGLFVAIIVAMIVGELFSRLSRTKALVIKMPDGVPPAVARSFSALFPGLITVFAISTLGIIIGGLSGGQNVFELMNIIVAPLKNLSDTLGAALIIVFVNQVLWFFGLHGSNILEGVIQPLSLPLLEDNMMAAQNGVAGNQLPHIVTKPWLDSFVHLGGSGATLGLVIAVLLISRSKQQRMMGKLSIAPALFNINEPVIFGMPIVLNIVFVIPFILIPLMLVLISYAASSMGLVNRTVAMVPWATPPILSGFLATGGDFRACLLQLINIALSIVCYIPFARIADRAEMKKENENEARIAAGEVLTD